MPRRRIIGLMATAALFSAAAGVAQAADKAPAKPLDFTVKAEPATAAAPAKAVKWDARKGRFGVTLNLEQPDVRPSNLNDIQAGAYFRITPSIRVGGAVALGDQRITPGPQKPTAADGQPRVRLESSFKF